MAKNGSGLVPVQLAIMILGRFLRSPLARVDATAHLDLAREAGLVADGSLEYGLLIDFLAGHNFADDDRAPGALD